VTGDLPERPLDLQQLFAVLAEQGIGAPLGTST
jgi:hypothetical protein